MQNEEFLQIKNFVHQIVTDNYLSTDNFETVVTQLFLNQITDWELLQFLYERLKSQKFTPLSELVQLIYTFFTSYTQDEARASALIAQRNRLLIKRHYLHTYLAERQARIQELSQLIDGARDDEKKRLSCRFCYELRGMQGRLDGLLAQQRTSVLGFLQQQSVSHKMAMFTLKTSQVLKTKDIRTEAFYLSDEISRMARKTHQAQIIAANESKRAFAQILAAIYDNANSMAHGVEEMARFIICGAYLQVLSVFILLFGLSACIWRLSCRFGFFG